MCIVYQYDSQGFFVGQTEDYNGPLPHNCTPKQPVTKAGVIPRWTGSAWEQVDNHKGVDGYLDGEPHTIEDYGPLPEGWSESLPPPSLEEARTAALEQLRLKKWEVKEAGITVNGIGIDTDTKGQETISGALLNVFVDPNYTANWKTAQVDESGKAVRMQIGAEIIMPLAKALTSYTQACFDVEATKEDELTALKSVDAISAWLATELDNGWPSREIVLG